MNKEMTERMVAWLTSEHDTEENVRQGATLLLQVNRNQGMYQRIMRNPLRHVETVVYQLQKHIDMRLEGYSIGDVVRLNSEVMPPIKEAVVSEDEGKGKTAKGKRPDHDSLPQDVKDIWEQNAERWKKIKEVYNTCKSLNKPCDRFEHLKVLKEAWYTYKKEMARYDDFKTDGTGGASEGGAGVPVLSAEDTKAVSAARSYLSKNLKNWTSPTEDQLAKIRERVDLLNRLHQTIGDDLKSQLLAIGIQVGEDA